MKQLIRLTLRPAPPQSGPSPVGLVIPFPPTPRPPEDATTLARASLANLRGKIKRTLAAGKVTDPITKAHLEETQARIAETLQAQIQKPIESHGQKSKQKARRFFRRAFFPLRFVGGL